MKLTSRLTISGLLFLILASGIFAQEPSPREQFQAAVSAYQKNTAKDTALKVIELYKQLEPSPAVPEEARRPFVMGATVLKKANDKVGAAKAAEYFTEALKTAPWFAEAYYNRALAREIAGQFTQAMEDLKLYLAFSLSDAERREAQDKIYSLEADAQLAAAKQAEDQKAAAAKEQAAARAAAAEEDRKKNSIEGYWFWTGNDNFPAGTTPSIQVVRVGQSLEVKPHFQFEGSTITEVQIKETSLRITYMPAGTINCHMLLVYELRDGDLVGTTTNLEMRAKGSRNATMVNRFIRKPWPVK